MKRITIVLLLVASAALGNTPPEVTYFSAQQRANTMLVDVTYSVTDSDFDDLTVSLFLLDNSGVVIMQCTSVSGSVGTGIQPGTNKSITWDASADFPGQYGSDYTLRVVADDGYSPPAPEGFVEILPGTFQMGSPTDEPGHSTNETLHTVTLTQGFYMSTTEVTEEWWDAVMGSGSSTSQLPKANVSWDDAVAFCNQLSLDAGLTPAYTINGTNGDATWNHGANGYRLPTEAEWEYACRADSQTAFCNGPITDMLCSDPNLDQVGWYCGNGGGASHDVGQKTANAWGLHDMHGNLWEWVWDGYRSDYQNLSSEDPVYDVGPGAYRLIRGGSWSFSAQYCRSAYRFNFYAYFSYGSVGFRPVRSTN